MDSQQGASPVDRLIGVTDGKKVRAILLYRSLFLWRRPRTPDYQPAMKGPSIDPRIISPEITAVSREKEEKVKTRRRIDEGL
jgi:hypothetical protein